MGGTAARNQGGDGVQAGVPPVGDDVVGPEELSLTVHPDGRVEFIHDDALVALVGATLTIHIRRASHVEPTESGQWIADMSPVCGPTLGPFPTRAAALAVERAWLRNNRNL